MLIKLECNMKKKPNWATFRVDKLDDSRRCKGCEVKLGLEYPHKMCVDCLQEIKELKES